MIDEIKTQSLLLKAVEELQKIRKYVEDLLQPKPVQGLVWRDDNYVKRLLNISDTTLWRMKRAGTLEGVEIGGRFYYTDAYLQELYEQRRKNK